MGSKNLKTIAAIVLSSFLTILFCYSPANSIVPKESNKEEILSKFYSLEIPFLENEGQIKDASVKYYAKTLGAGFFITKDGQIAYSLTKSEEGKGVKAWTIKESFVGVSPLDIKCEGNIPVKINEFKGKDPSEWKISIPAYDRVILGEIYAGIELSLKAYGDSLEKLFYIKPLAKIEEVRLQIEGANGLRTNENGELEVETDLGVIRFSKPSAYQEEKGEIKYVEVQYVVSGDGYSFAVGEYDRTKALVIASSLLSTFASSAVDEASPAMAIDGSGNVYIAGATASPDFPTTSGACDMIVQDSTDVFIAKLDGSLNHLLATALLGGAEWDEAYAITIDELGNVYAAGGTASADFPTTPGAYSSTYMGGEDAFLAKFDQDLQTLLSSSYFGDSGNDRITSITIDRKGNVSVAGTTTSQDISALFGVSGSPKDGSPVPFTATFDNNLSPYSAPQSIASPLSIDESSKTNQLALNTPEDQIQTQKETAKPGKPYQSVGEGWFNVKGDSVSTEEGEIYYKNKQKEAALEKAGALTLGILAAESPSSEILELARALRYDPKLIYDYVHNHIDYVPYYGSRKGATLTYLDGSGNDFDQASLMISLLKASGYTAQYIYGTMTIPGSQLANWLGVDQTKEAIGSALGNGGIPKSNQQADGTTKVTRVWVKATIGGVDYLFDPAFKSYSYKNKINIGQAMGYSQSDLLAAAGGTVGDGGYSIQNLNETNLRNKLATYASNLVTAIRSQYPNSDVSDIISGRSIIQTNLTQYQTTLPFSPVVTTTWPDSIPAAETATLQIQHTPYGSSSADIDYTYNIPDLSGKRITLTYAGSDRHAELREDGNLIASGGATTAGHKNTLKLIIIHRRSGYAFASQTVYYYPDRDSTYAIVYNFGGISDSLLQKRQEQLETYRVQGLADTSEQVLGETLNIMGQTWLKEVAMSNRLLSALADTVVITHNNVGLMAQETGYYIDVKAGLFSTVSKHNIDADWQAHFKVLGLIGSAFEHGILEQLMGSDKPAVSTMKLFQIANSTSRKVFYANSSNFAAIRPLLQNYPANVLNDFQFKVNDGHTLILPANGQLVLNNWRGKGYIDMKYTSGIISSMGMIIDGGYFGGFNSYKGPVNYNTVIYNIPQYEPPPTIQNSYSNEPVDMTSGAYLHDHADLQLGGNAPLGIAFARSYNSNKSLSKRTLGYGWTHSYDIYLTPTSNGEPGLGNRQPADAAGMIAALYACLDLLKTQDTIKAWMVASLTSKWAVDQVIDNAFTVHLGNKVMEYIKLADGTYASPPGITTQLIKNGDGTFSLQERFGTRINFNTDKKIAQIIDIDGNTMTFTYTGTDLTTVRDAFNRTLTLQYSGGRIIKVSDSAGRSVSYGYDASSNLTSYTDAETKQWGYGYDTSHRMTSLSNPLGITTATNVYDSLGRVMTQTVPRQGGTNATYNFYFSGFRNVEEDPAGNTITYYYDEKGREFAQENALGNKTIKGFDGQDHVTKITDPRSYSTNIVYDGNHNVTEVINALSQSTKNKYDVQFRITDTIDPLLHGSHLEYDTEHHPILSKYGILYDTQILPLDNGIFQTGASYYANGLVNTATDGKGAVTTMTYNAYGGPLTTSTNSHPAITYAYDPIGRMTNLTDQVSSGTSFVYDKRSLLQNKTDPLNRPSTFTYDNAGRLYTKTDRNNNTITYQYTPSDKLERITYPSGTPVILTYNQLDQLMQMQDSLGTTTYTYDAVGRPSSSTDPHGFAVLYSSYDANGNLTELTYPGNKKVIYTYDELNRLKTVKINWLSGTPIATYNYDSAGRLTSLTNFNGTVSTYGYDNANRLVSLENKKSDLSVIATYQFTLDGNGNRTQGVQNEPLVPTIPVGNTTYSYNTQRNRLLSAGAVSFGYDNEGQLNNGYGSSYTFDYEHRLIGIASSYQFSYDGIGNRLEAVRSGVVTRYIYDAAGNLLAEADGLNNITRYYVYGLGLLAMVTPSDQVYCYHFNAVGSTIGMTDQTQAMVNKYVYDPFGNIANQVEAVTQPFKFVGQLGVMTEPNGFYYMKARYYDPDVGRFISEDPIGFEGGDVNLMAYVGNNPVMGVDPQGACGQSQSIQSPWWLSWVPGQGYWDNTRNDFANGNYLGTALNATAMVAEQVMTVYSIAAAASSKVVSLSGSLGELSDWARIGPT